MNEQFEAKYDEILMDYLEHQDEAILYDCEKLTKEAMDQSIPPEEIINIHRSALEKYDKNMPDYVKKSFDVLLETMVGYGLAYLEHISLRTEQRALKSEIEQAESMQKTLLQADLPTGTELDFGVVSKAARQMSGDYYAFLDLDGKKENIGISLADVIGKGIPAAFSISMIKYALPGIAEEYEDPSRVLRALNKVAEENINDNMFITMFYGVYRKALHRFEYASAGHEVGVFYEAKTNQFSDLYARGLPLGINKEVEYRKFERAVAPEDVIFIMSDGVTETRTKEGFLERPELLAIFEKYMKLEAQEMADAIYEHLLKLQDFKLHDDFTLIVIKREKEV
ncbi:PP2C family protein-serine/threonine phosphatase [Listeria aquatica]|uniref:Phosphoserine phosphatase rsbU n=2 Tax=Listeria aquatica TaxID=1494960 RepID=W7BH51_9LIST|nr:PP2C family protein-serine/threonine phosphatase [Listeria aquatica]EUJ19078.1 Phosphoserine phosphatase rsbU [Listeria aquatica FSL S10-1188]MBC1520258.1 PP2C family protein-serine/threonine phosphatase [Listeria aquatica]